MGRLPLSGLSAILAAIRDRQSSIARRISGASLLGLSRRWAVYTLLIAGLTVVVFASLVLAFRPTPPIAPTHLGGLLVRITQVEMEVWFTALGLCLATYRREANTTKEVHPA